ncbi:MBL fold metallo-hydrolase [Pararhodobacter sp. SW119]|uniref:MBL fold metallo-hydrolase n=1 Tax=Pararhodobacter sp. SW119 TaxID=2780075 RepID=UPI001AE0E5FD|nr:MBL fold metallo-hydrolase [Pararhodobacter sp. SW119]
MSRTATRKIGNAEVTILTDGGISFPAEYFPGTDEAHIEELLRDAGRSEIETNFNAVLIRSGGRVILVDAGPRDLFGPTCGFLPEALKEAGVSPAEVDTLLATHLHPDHVAGMITAEGKAVFENAVLHVPAAERAFWSDESKTVGEPLADWGKLARAVLAAYAGRLEEAGDGIEVAPGLSTFALPGHTPGHSGWRLSSGAEQLLHVGDIIHAPALQVADPEVGIAFDLDMDTARATRKRLLDELASDGALFTGGHFLHPAFHQVERKGQGYRLVRP